MNLTKLQHLLSVFFLIVLALSAAGCNFPTKENAETDEGAVALPDLEGTSLPYLEVTVTPHDESKIIIMTLMPDAESNVIQVDLMLPEELAGAEIFVNDVSVEGVDKENYIVSLDLAGKVSSPEVTIVFESGGTQLATCTITTANPLNPLGDCSW